MWTTKTSDLAKFVKRNSANRTRLLVELGQLFSGKKNVTLADVLKVQFWSETVRDLIMFALSAIPRVLVALLLPAVQAAREASRRSPTSPRARVAAG